MKRNIAVFMILIIGFVLFASNLGCITTTKSVQHRELSGKQKAQAEDWQRSATLLYKVGDYSFALDYYKKIVKYYPGTIYAKEAQDKIDDIKKVD